MEGSRDEEDEAAGRAVLRLEEEVVAGFGPREMAIYRSLPPTRQAKARRRLAVIRGWNSNERSELFADVAAAARAAGVSVTSFYRILASVRSAGFDGLGLHAGVRARRPRTDAVEKAASLLGEDAAAKAEELLERLPDGAISRSAAAAAMAEARRSLPANEPFGALVVFDAASLDAVGVDGVRRRLYALLDVATGLVLSWRLDRDRDFEAGYAAVARSYLDDDPTNASLRPALGRLAQAPPPPVVEAVLPRGVDLQFNGRLLRAGVRSVRDDRAVGARLRTAVGGRLAGFGLSAGFAAPDVLHRSRVRTELPVLDDPFDERVAAALVRHNEERLRLAVPGSGRETAAALSETVAAVAHELF